MIYLVLLAVAVISLFHFVFSVNKSHMTAAVGLPTLRLVRVAIGPIAFGELQPGQWRTLSPAEVSALNSLVSAETRLAKPEKKPVKSSSSNPGSRYRNAGRRSPGR
jgi:23S rRNA pseudouridine2457 synthase